ncbi:MAG: hypothetical protein ACOX63_13265 [Christensenellales bacterium]
MNFQETLDFMRHHPWNFYYVYDSKDKDDPNGESWGWYRERREQIDYIGSMINTVGIEKYWVGIDTYDFTSLDQMVEALLKEYPDRFFVPRIPMEPPIDWQHAHPEELCVYWKGPQNAEEIRALIGTPHQDMRGWDEDNQRNPYPDEWIAQQSFSSKLWVQDASKALTALVKHIEQSPYARQTIGYMVGFGNCGENMWWGDWRNQGDPRKGDFGITHKRLFFEWAIEKYGSLSALRKAWGLPELTLENLPMPTPPERWSENGKDLRGVLLAHDQRQVDCNEFHSKACFDALESFGKIVHEVAGKPAGGFYGYLQDETVGYAGHLAIDRAMTTPYVDFYSSPKAYHYCLAGDPGASQAPGQSFARKKLWIEENDSRSHHALGIDPSRANKTPADTFTVFWREIYRALTFNHGFWWMNINGVRDDWYADETMVNMFRQQADFFKKWSPIPRKGVAQVIFIEDEDSCEHTTYISGPQRNLRLRLERELRLCGVPVDHMRISDLFEIDMSQYRFIVFCHAFVMPFEKWKAIRARIRPDAHILWNWAAGMLDPMYNPENQKAVTGFYTAECPERMHHPDLYRHIYWHTTHRCPQDYPLIQILPDVGQEILQTSPDGCILTARIARDEGANIFAADFTLREPLLRQLLCDAGVRFYAPANTAVFADEKLIGFFPRWDVSFTYPFIGKWRNVITDEIITGSHKLSIRSKGLEIFENIGE